VIVGGRVCLHSTCLQFWKYSRPVNHLLENSSAFITSNAFPFPFRNVPAVYTSVPSLPS
jgi:hypothetical protein